MIILGRGKDSGKEAMVITFFSGGWGGVLAVRLEEGIGV